LARAHHDHVGLALPGLIYDRPADAHRVKLHRLGPDALRLQIRARLGKLTDGRLKHVTGGNGQGGRIVVGVDGSPGSRTALELAHEEARLRGAILHAIHVWRVPLGLALPEPSIAGHAPVSADDLDQLAARLREQAEALLDRMVSDELGDDPDVEVRREVVEANPAEALIESARGADLLVVGSRGLGGFRGLLLGSVGQHVAQHAPCPVAIVPQDRLG
jgi:nucleotide-binding universal stress UspA family protein